MTREGENYLNKHHKIGHPNDLLKHHWLVAQPLSKIVLTNQQSDEVVKLNISTARFQVNEISLCIALAKQHLGLTYVPKWLCQAELKNGQLIYILPRRQMPKRDIYTLYGAQNNSLCELAYCAMSWPIFFINTAVACSLKQLNLYKWYLGALVLLFYNLKQYK